MVGAGRVTGEGTEDALAAALAEIAVLRVENERLRDLLGLTDERSADPPVAWEPTLFSASQTVRPTVDRRSSPAEKIELYRSLFSGRDDVFALRWQNDRTGKSGWSPAVVGGWVNSKRPDRSYEPLDGSGDRASLGRRDRRGSVPASAERPVPVAGVRLRRWVVGARRIGLPRRLPRCRSPGGVGAVSLWRWRPRVDLLLRSCRRGRCPQGRRSDVAPSDGISRRDRSGELRPAVPVAGRDAEGVVREPDRTAVAGRVPPARRHRVPRPVHARPVRRSVGVPVVAAVGEPGSAAGDRGVGASASGRQRRGRLGTPTRCAARPGAGACDLVGDGVDRADRSAGMAARSAEASGVAAQPEVLRERTTSTVEPRDPEADPVLCRGARRVASPPRAARRGPRR